MNRAFQFLQLALFLIVTSLLLKLICFAQGVEAKIAFFSNRNNDSGIYTMDADGANPIKLIGGGGPTWSPDGLQIAFHGGNGVGGDIFLIDENGNNLRSLTKNRIDQNIFPAWSPDGTRIAFVSNRRGNWDIYVMTADGKNLSNLTWDLLQEDRPSWSPDGTKIAFGAYQRIPQGNRAESEVFVIGADGADRINLTQNARAINGYPSWSPDGRKIAYRASPKPGLWFAPFNIYVMNADGTNPVMLTEERRWASESRPNWSPDGRKIVFVAREPDGSNDIYSIVTDGSGLINLTQTPHVNDNSPSWRPARLSVSSRGNFMTKWGAVKQNSRFVSVPIGLQPQSSKNRE